MRAAAGELSPSTTARNAGSLHPGLRPGFYAFARFASWRGLRTKQPTLSLIAYFSPLDVNCNAELSRTNCIVKTYADEGDHARPSGTSRKTREDLRKNQEA